MNDAELSGKLIDLIGPTLVALASGSSNRHSPMLWRGGVVRMTGPQRQRLETALECLEAIERTEGQDMGRAWFIGANTGEDLTSPAEALCEGRLEDVRLSMKRFIDPEQMGK